MELKLVISRVLSSSSEVYLESIALDLSLQQIWSRVPFLLVITALEQPATSQLQLKYLELFTKLPGAKVQT